ncbi:hypothetical protein SEA_MARIOKART_37 [Gordonia phage Mariokart]|nr:hypothetical protein SEA_MARIOKART_37 [Gordonia phage Mariokart]
MAQMWRGNGAGYDEIPSMRVGNGPVGEMVKIKTWNGTAYVDRWIKPMVYRMQTTATLGGTGTSWLDIANWTVSSGYPYTLISSNDLVIPAGLPVYRANLYAGGSISGGTAPRYGQLRIRVNGTVAVEGAQATGSPDTVSAFINSVDMTPGMMIDVQYRGEGNFFNRPTLAAGAYLSVTPVALA